MAATGIRDSLFRPKGMPRNAKRKSCKLLIINGKRIFCFARHAGLEALSTGCQGQGWLLHALPFPRRLWEDTLVAS